MKTLKLKELWAENKAIRMAFLLIVAFGALVMATLTLMGGDDSNQKSGNDSNLLIVFYVQIMPDDLVMQLHRF